MSKDNPKSRSGADAGLCGGWDGQVPTVRVHPMKIQIQIHLTPFCCPIERWCRARCRNVRSRVSTALAFGVGLFWATTGLEQGLFRQMPVRKPGPIEAHCLAECIQLHRLHFKTTSHHGVWQKFPPFEVDGWACRVNFQGFFSGFLLLPASRVRRQDRHRPRPPDPHRRLHPVGWGEYIMELPVGSTSAVSMLSGSRWPKKESGCNRLSRKEPSTAAGFCAAASGGHTEPAKSATGRQRQAMPEGCPAIHPQSWVLQLQPGRVAATGTGAGGGAAGGWPASVLGLSAGLSTVWFFSGAAAGGRRCSRIAGRC